MEFIKADSLHIAEIGRLYDELCDYLCEHGNYPGWKKDVYPTVNDAADGVKEGALYIAVEGGKIAGAVILRHKPEDGYKNVEWLTENDYEKIYVIYTLAVHPNYLRTGVGKGLLDFAEQIARENGCVSLRLDVVKGNIPAESLYEKFGFKYIGTTSLGYEKYGLPWYDLWEKVLV
ncbi:MAG: GNAT family N-acetyltransferase [Oscillospiraceae bacterium]|nr:GNAT family N-acetyltransferase [Oscillospiraceae bacterium]MBQ9939885.1 GNAT family N-acetyltransferase [Oscillospiraceae bacterium]